MKKCTGENCPMQMGYDFENCAAIDKCPYRTWPVTIADRIRSMTDNDLAGVLFKLRMDCITKTSLVFRRCQKIGTKLKNGLKPRGRASRERCSKWGKCDGTINE